MNVPLDNLYEWIADRFPSCVIYRFYPHGSKKLGDLDPINAPSEYTARVDKIHMVCNDQEPLHYDLYNNMDWRDVRCTIQHPSETVASVSQDNQRFWQYQCGKNIFAKIPFFWDKNLLLHSEKNSIEVEKYRHLAIPAYWWSHAMIAGDWYRYALYDQRLKFHTDNFQWDFNCYSRESTGSRAYRQKFYDILMHQEGIAHCRPMGSQTTQLSSTLSATYDTVHYQTCAIDVVLETLFEDQRWHITEKTLRALACGKPFILAGTPGSLRYIRSYGFKTFSPYINENYDHITDHSQRLQAITSEMMRIACLPKQQKSKLFQGCHAIAEHNKKHFFSDKFMNMIVDELHQNVNDAIATIAKHHGSGKKFAEERRHMTWHERQEIKRRDLNGSRLAYYKRCRAKARSVFVDDMIKGR